MTNRLQGAVSPYLQSHSENPVDWYSWGTEAFAEARRRSVPLLVSIGYSTCHWCHVMARESFSDPLLAAVLNENFVAIKVDREEHPDVDASYLAAAAAFTENLGWPLNVFVTPTGKPFYAGTYWPPNATSTQPSFGEVLSAVSDAFSSRRDEVEATAAAVSNALSQSSLARDSSAQGSDSGLLPSSGQLAAVVRELASYEDGEYGGFGGAPKFPVAPVVLFLLERAASGGAAASAESESESALALASRTLLSMAGSGTPDTADGKPYSALRDRVEGGFFRYATLRNWDDPHYERMLYDNAQLLTAYTRLSQLSVDSRHESVAIADGIADFLLTTLQQPNGGFASAQDSESSVDGSRVEGAYYALDATARAHQPPPAVDAKVLTGWNGLAIGALSTAGSVLGRPALIDAARRAADLIIATHLRPDGSVLRASISGGSPESPGSSSAGAVSPNGRFSEARATLEDYGLLADGLLALSLASGESSYAIVARTLIERAMDAAKSTMNPAPFAVPGGADPLLVSQGTALAADPSEGAYPSGLSAMAAACYSLYLLTGYARYREASTRVIELLAPLALPRPISFGAALAVSSALAQPISQLIVVTEDENSALAAVARANYRSGSITAILTPAQAARFADDGFELFFGRQRQAAYLCQNFVCRLPQTDAAELERALSNR